MPSIMPSKHVPLSLDLLGGFYRFSPAFFKALGRVETACFQYDIADIKIERPIFITGLPRSGTTILLEILNAYNDTVSFRYRDYPFVHMPVFWKFMTYLMPSSSEKAERAHKDGLFINGDSPEMLDEIIWMSFFDHLHDTDASNMLGDTVTNPDFERVLLQTIRKLIFRNGRGEGRYLSKNNYCFSRISYLLKLFPDATFVIPFRNPVNHIFSLLKQNDLIMQAQKDSKRVQRYMDMHGHFEFGQNFRPLNLGGHVQTAEIEEYWQAGEYLQAYTMYWRYVHSYMLDHVFNNSNVSGNIMALDYDSLCHEPEAAIFKLANFCGVAGHNDVPDVKAPDYYTVSFSDADLAFIHDQTDDVYNKLRKVSAM